jgi:hypothetical protein
LDEEEEEEDKKLDDEEEEEDKKLDDEEAMMRIDADLRRCGGVRKEKWML